MRRRRRSGVRPAQGSPRARIVDDREEVAVCMARELLRRALEAVRARGVFRVALSGGSASRPFLRRLARSADDPLVPWSRVHFFWAEEAADGSGAGFARAYVDLLRHLPIGPANVHRVPFARPASDAAERYEAELLRAFDLAPGETPRFDVVQLHPGFAVRATEERLVTVVGVGDAARIGITVPVLRAARAVSVAACGVADAASLVQQGIHRPDELRVRPPWLGDGRLLWLLDRIAAGQLETSFRPLHRQARRLAVSRAR